MRTEPSGLKSEICNKEKIMKHFQDLESEAANMLLFLKNVQLIEVLHWEKGAKNPTSLFKVTITELGTKNRSKIYQDIKKLQSSQNVRWTGCGIKDSLFEVEITLEKNHKIEKAQWVIVNSISDAASMLADEYAAKHQLKLVPWTSIAYCTSQNNNNINGKAFTVLPLPIETGK